MIILKELKAFVSRDISEYQSQDYYDLSQKARLLLLSILGFIATVIIILMMYYFRGNQDIDESAITRIKHQSEYVVREIAELHSIQKMPEYVNIAAFLAAHHRDNEAEESSILMTLENEALLVERLRASLALLNLPLISLTPKREWIVLSSDIINVTGTSHSNPRRRNDTSSKESNRNFSRLFQPLNEDELDDSRTFSQYDGHNLPARGLQRFIFAFSTCAPYGDLLAGLSLFAKRTAYIVSLDQLVLVDASRHYGFECIDSEDKSIKQIEVQLSLYSLPHLYDYLQQADLDFKDDDLKRQLSLTPLSLQQYLMDYSLEKKKESLMYLDPISWDLGQDNDDLHNRDNKYLFQIAPKNEQVESREIADVTLQKLKLASDSRQRWHIGEKHNEWLLVGIIWSGHKEQDAQAIIQKSSGTFITIGNVSTDSGYHVHSEGIDIDSADTQIGGLKAAIEGIE